MRKLKRKKKISKESSVEKKQHVIKRYKRQKCQYVSPDGKKCNRWAVGKGTLCRIHGGNPIIKENLIPADKEKALKPIDSTYDPAKHPMEYIQLSRMGLSETEIAAQFGTYPGILNNWAEKYENFALAVEIGKNMHKSWWINEGKGNLDNRGYNTSLYKFLTANLLGFSDKMETKNMNMNVHGVLMVPNKMTEKEWEEEVIDVNS